MAQYQTQQNNKEPIKCKYCSIQGLEWYKTSEGLNRLRFVFDKEPHTREECDNIKNRVEGFSFAEVIMKHKNNTPKQQQSSSYNITDTVTNKPEYVHAETIKEPPQAAGRNTIPQDYITKEFFEAQITEVKYKLSEYINDFWSQHSRLMNEIASIKEAFSKIPGFNEALEESKQNSFTTAKDLHKNQEPEEEKKKEEPLPEQY